MKIIQGSNAPLVIGFNDSVVVDINKFSALLFTQKNEIELKHWLEDDIVVKRRQIELPLTEEETLGFPTELCVLEVKFSDADGNITLWDSTKCNIIKRKDTTRLNETEENETEENDA